MWIEQSLALARQVHAQVNVELAACAAAVCEAGGGEGRRGVGGVGAGAEEEEQHKMRAQVEQFRHVRQHLLHELGRCWMCIQRMRVCACVCVSVRGQAGVERTLPSAPPPSVASSP